MKALLASPFPMVLAGPSGSGKTTIARALADGRPDVRFAVSATTRPPRPDEEDGVDYHFLDEAGFERLRKEGGLLEWAEVHGHRYGTPREELSRALEAGAHLLLDIDVQGARSVRRSLPEVVTVFLLPPSGERILERLRARGSEDESALRRRLRAAEEELRAVSEFDYAVVNDELAACVRVVEGILEAERRRVARLGERADARAGALVREIESTLG